MALVKGGLFGLDASGTIAGTLTFSKWKGRPYVRQTVTPANPRSGLQVGVRAVFKFITQAYAGMDPVLKARWATIAAITNITALNAQVKEDQARARQNLGIVEDPTHAPIGTPGEPTSPAATGATRSVILTWTQPIVSLAYCTFIYRSLTGTFAKEIGKLIAVVPFSFATYTDADVVTGTTYHYALKNCNIAGELSIATAEVTATPT